MEKEKLNQDKHSPNEIIDEELALAPK
jgi:hypothetical protein